LQNQFDQWYANLHSRGAEKLLQFQDVITEESNTKLSHAMVTADAKSDMDVNEDIMAFYQAKEELLKRKR
jgi:hypothetical protein